MASHKMQYNPSGGGVPDRRHGLSKIPASASRLPSRSTAAGPSQQKPVATGIPASSSPSKLTKKKRVNVSEQAQNTMGPSVARHGMASSAGVEDRPRRAMGGPLGPSSGLQQPSRLARFDPAFLNSSTPSLVSGSSVSTFDSPRSTLRQRPNPGDRATGRPRPTSMASQEDASPPENSPSVYSDSFPDTVLGISLPPAPASLSAKGKQAAYHIDDQSSFNLPPRIATSDLPPPVPLYAASASPSTRYSESPFSLASTPNSMSSYSPGIAITSKSSWRTRQTSPTHSRPPVSLIRRMTDENDPSDPQDPQGLPSVRESSSSSNASTIKASDGVRYHAQKKRKDSLGSSDRPRANSIDKVKTSLDKSRSPPPMMPPPEFAHLMDIPGGQGAMARRPSRPSRDGTEGTAEILRLRGPSPIIQSNLHSLPYTSHRRQSSGDSKTGAPVTVNSRTRFGAPAKSNSRNQSPNPSLTSSFSPPPPNTRSVKEASIDINESDKLSRPTMSPNTSSPGKSTGRFGFFRRAKTEPAPPPEPAAAPRKLRKGPMAGTGHEGYNGRHVARGRSGSTTSGTSISVGRSASSDSIAGSATRVPNSRKSSIASRSGQDMDDFLLERLNPVTLRGGSAQSSTDKLAEVIRSPGSIDSGADREHLSPLLAVHSAPQASAPQVSVSAPPRPTLLPSPMNEPLRSGSPVKRSAVRPEVLEDAARAKRSPASDLVSRRFSRKSLSSEFQAAAKTPVPSNNEGQMLLPPMESPMMSGANSEFVGGAGPDGNQKGWFWSKKPEVKQEPQPGPKPRLQRKWNFFQRARTSSPERGKTPVNSALPPQPRSVAHYALMGTGNVDITDLEELMQEADNGPDEPLNLPEFAPISTSFVDSEAGRGLSILMPGAEVFSSEPVHHLRVETPVSPRAPRPESTPDEEHEPLTPASVYTDIDPRPSSGTFWDTGLPHALAPPQSEHVEVQLASTIPPVAPLFATIQTQQLSPTPVPEPQVPVSPPKPRPSRLAQVGRIPAVVSRRDRDRVLPNESFSRPFAPQQPAPSIITPPLPAAAFPAPVPMVQRETEQVQAPPPFMTQRRPSDVRTFSSKDLPQIPTVTQMGNTKVRNHIEAILPKPAQTVVQSPPTREFLRFSRKNSQTSSYSTTSSASGMLPISVPVAVMPHPNMPPMEDEIWKEYDDLIDDVLLPTQKAKTPTSACSAGSSLGAPFHFSRLLRESTHVSALKRRSDETEKRPSRIMSAHKVSRSTDSALPTLRTPSGRGSRLLSALYPLATPKTPMSISDLLEGYGDRNLSVVDPVSGRLSFPTNRASSGSGRLSVPSHKRGTSEAVLSFRSSVPSVPEEDPQSLEAANRNGDTRMIEMAETKDNGLTSMANLRFGALMTSKWLSFGRVLVSPAHFELKNKDEDRVLILDGLGKDWSYYVALTYPNASVYNLGPNPSESSGQGSEAGQGLPNHRHIHHAHLSANFPFPKGFFAAVVFRFPIATSEAAFRAAIFECKRVLRPGGYLEVSLLDLDLVNMGNKARKAVREMKMQMQICDPSVSLKPASDNIQKLLGRRGFENLNRCIVGVPTAGRIPGSGDGLGDDDENGMSFSDLLKDSTNHGDDKITKMVARVGRWWYSRCYESVALPNGDLSKSIWNDTQLVRECEKKGTSFRLLICYAQKPTVTVRRTVSV